MQINHRYLFPSINQTVNTTHPFYIYYQLEMKEIKYVSLVINYRVSNSLTLKITITFAITFSLTFCYLN